MVFGGGGSPEIRLATSSNSFSIARILPSRKRPTNSLNSGVGEYVLAFFEGCDPEVEISTGIGICLFANQRHVGRIECPACDPNSASLTQPPRCRHSFAPLFRIVKRMQ